MSKFTPTPNRLSRTAAKHAPHREDDRFYAARAAVSRACEDLIHDIRRLPLHAPMAADFTSAVRRVEQHLQEARMSVARSTATIRDSSREVQHLHLAASWVSAAERVLTRLGSKASKSLRDRLLEAQDAVMWHVRADRWGGDLTAATAQLESVVKEAEASAARLVS